MGRPPGSSIKSKTVQTRKSAAGKAKKVEPERSDFHCCRCTRTFIKQMGNFSKVRSPMYACNDGYLHVCNHCLQELYDHYEEVLGSKKDAIYRLCMKFDVFYSDMVYNMTLGGAVRDNPMKNYISKTNLAQVKGTSFDDTLDHEAMESGDLVLEKKEAKAVCATGETVITSDDVERWGTGFAKEEYQAMDTAFTRLTKGETNVDFLREKYIKDLCVITVQADRALKQKDVKTYSELLTLYQRVATAAQVKVANTEIDTANDSFGKWLACVENHTPAEYYADKTKYRDFFGIGEYCERFIFRPLKNWVMGARDKDKEFNIDGQTG